MTRGGSPQSSSGLAYRPEIDGLRAIAVVAVILYHGHFPWIPGGFLGVDLFFVISGYLITGIIAADLRGGRFSIARFYERRIRRIIPALMLVMLLCIPLAWWLMLPDDLENFGQSLVGTTLFANNIVLLLTSGYFGMEVQFKPLLHTWSLGVEEQYYLLVPLLMWAAWRIGRGRAVFAGAVLVTLLSFIACLALARYDPRFNFFLIVSRAWELGVGSLAVIVEPRLRRMAGPRLCAALALIGLALMVVPLFWGFHFPAPGYRTTIPLAGICLILIFGGTRDPAGRILSSTPFVAIGLISYSAYLFHQPIFAFVRLVSFDEPSLAVMAALLIPIFLCAWASWRWVEQPFRDRTRISTRTVLLSSAAAAAVVLAAGLTFHFTSGFFRNWPELADGNSGRNANIAYNMAANRFANLPLPETKERVRVLVIGDSFARDFINMGVEAGGFAQAAVSMGDMGACGPMRPRMLERARRADFIVFARRYPPGSARCIVADSKKLRSVTSAPIIVIGRKSFGYNNNALMRLPREQRIHWRMRPLDEAMTSNEELKRLLPAGTYIDVMGLIADDRGLVPAFNSDGKFISQDREHVTRAGAQYVGEIIFRHPALAALADAIRNPPKAPAPAPQKP